MNDASEVIARVRQREDHEDQYGRADDLVGERDRDAHRPGAVGSVAKIPNGPSPDPPRRSALGTPAAQMPGLPVRPVGDRAEERREDVDLVCAQALHQGRDARSGDVAVLVP